jgi:acyl-CoA thioesterase-1
VLMVLVSCNSSQNNEEKMEDKLTYLALGDSYTIGESVAESDRWPIQLTETLQTLGIAIENPQIIAKTGWTTDELLNAISTTKTKERYDLVSLLIGVNNQYRNYPIDTFKVEFEILLKKALAYADNNPKKVFVVSIPDYGATPFGQTRDADKIALEIDDYNLVSKKIADRYQIQYFNITDVSREALNDPKLTADDNLHPSGKMYAKWVKIITSGISPILSE